MPNKLAGKEPVTDSCCFSLWSYLPDHLLLHIFGYLSPRDVLDASQVCYQWYYVAMDEYLWRDLFYSYFKISRRIPMAPGMSSWKSEFKRLSYHTPVIESEVLHQHKDQVLHVSFSHDGKLFATTSKDGFIKVWNAVYPCTMKHCADMKEHAWKYTQFSQFNSNDTLLLVSGVHFGAHSTSGEIAVFSLDSDFELQCRVINKPYDIFGAWYNNSYLLSGNLYWRGNFSSSSVLRLNKASQAVESEHESVVTCLYQFLNQNASSIRTILVAKCPEKSSVKEDEPDRAVEITNTTAPCSCNWKCSEDSVAASENCLSVDYEEYFSSEDDELHLQEINGLIEHDHSYKKVEKVEDETDLWDECSQPAKVLSPCKEVTGNVVCSSTAHNSQPVLEEDFYDKYLIFTMGEKTYTPHQIGIKRIVADKAREIIGRLKHRSNDPFLPAPDDDHLPLMDDDSFDKVDHSIELHGHIIGMCLSPDQRYLYVNSRTWPQGYQISDPLSPPPISQEIDIHVIDLETLKEVGSLLRSHKAFTPNDECFFIFLDVSSQYIASGAEDKHGYMWDRHYGICIRKFPHTDVVNSVAFNPHDPEVLVSVSDDNSIKIWRSRNREREVNKNK